MSRTVTEICHVDLCPSCNQAHDLSLQVRLTRQTLLVGGPADAPEKVGFDVFYQCPVSGLPATAQVRVGVMNGEKAASVTVEAVEGPGGTTTGPPPSRAGQGPSDLDAGLFAEWRTSSAATLRSFCTTMLTASSGAVGVYFAVLKYLGVEKVGAGWQVMSIVPAVLFLGAVAAFAFGLRPTIAIIDEEEFTRFHDRRLAEMGRRAGFGMTLFMGALLTSVVIFVAVLLF